MQSIIRLIEMKDEEQVINMMREFYLSPALITNGSEEVFKANIDNCICNSEYLEGYVFCEGEIILGYGIIAKSFSTEFGKKCIWIEDLYVKEKYRKLGIGSSFIRFIEEKYKGCLLRLEVEKENAEAIEAYRKAGFVELPYLEMKK